MTLNDPLTKREPDVRPGMLVTAMETLEHFENTVPLVGGVSEPFVVD